MISGRSAARIDGRRALDLAPVGARRADLVHDDVEEAVGVVVRLGLDVLRETEEDRDRRSAGSSIVATACGSECTICSGLAMRSQ